jgi:hypothetical protein
MIPSPRLVALGNGAWKTKMSEERAEEPFAVQEIWLDGFSGVHINGETLRCTAFSTQDGHPVAVVKLIMTAQTAKLFIAQAREALNLRASNVRLIRERRKPG